MEINLYTVSIPPFARTLTALRETLKKAEAYAASRVNFAMDKSTLEASLLSSKIAFDQFDLKRQVLMSCDNAKLGAARIAGIPAPKHDDSETTFAELYKRIDETVAFIQTITPEMLEGRESAHIALPYWEGKEMDMNGYLTNHLNPNFYFHVTTAYSIMRMCGVEIGKQDYFGERKFL